MNNTELKEILEKDGLFRKDGKLNTAWVHNRSHNYDLSHLEGDTLQEKIYLLYHERSYCKICGKPNKFLGWGMGYTTVCSGECKKELDRRNLAEKAIPRVQSPEVRAKRKKTCLEKYGVDNPFKNKAIQQKIHETNIEKFGVAHPAQNKEVVKKMEATNRANHNGMWNSQTKEHRDHLKKTREALISEFEQKNNCTQIEKIISKYGQGFHQLNLPKIVYGRYKFISNDYLGDIQKHYQEMLLRKSRKK